MKTRRKMFSRRNLLGGMPEWYKIAEISFVQYVKCLRPLYEILEKRNKSKTAPDIFLITILAAYSGITVEQWNELEKQRLYENAISMKLGDFHEELMGKFPGYETLPRGHTTGTDVRKVDDSEFFEVKNRDNTLNSSSGESVVRKLTKIADEGKKSILVMINTEKKTLPRFKAPKSVDVMSGRQVYTYLSGRDTFYDDLIKTLGHTFTHYDSHLKLESSAADRQPRARV